MKYIANFFTEMIFKIYFEVGKKEERKDYHEGMDVVFSMLECGWKCELSMCFMHDEYIFKVIV